jgi:hypothetical protein
MYRNNASLHSLLLHIQKENIMNLSDLFLVILGVGIMAFILIGVDQL